MDIKILNNEGKLLKRFVDAANIILSCKNERVIHDDKTYGWTTLTERHQIITMPRTYTKNTLKNIYSLLDYYNLKYTNWYGWRLEQIEITEGSIRKTKSIIKKIM